MWPSHSKLMLPGGKSLNWERKPNRKMRQESGVLPVPTRKAVRHTGGHCLRPDTPLSPLPCLPRDSRSQPKSDLDTL